MIKSPTSPRKLPVWIPAALLAGLLCLAAAGVLAGPAGTPPPPDPTLAPPAPVTTQPTGTTQIVNLYELLKKGGVFMIPIAFCSVLGLAVIIERFVSLRIGKIIPRGFMVALKGVFQHTVDDREQGLEYCRSQNCPIARVAASGIRKLHKDEESVEQAIEDAGANEVAKLRRNLRMLYGVAAIAPMLGLLGTVWGMIEAFQVASVVGLGQAQEMAKGIYAALVTTFAGLCVAIPILMFYYYFLGRIERLVSHMNDASVEFLEHYIREEPVAAPVDEA